MAGADALQRVSISSVQHHEEEASELEKVGGTVLLSASFQSTMSCSCKPLIHRDSSMLACA